MLNSIKKFFGISKKEPSAPEIGGMRKLVVPFIPLGPAKPKIKTDREIINDRYQSRVGRKGCFGGPGRAGTKLSKRLKRNRMVEL